MNPLTRTSLQAELCALKDPAKAKILQSFFKTGKGQYGEGDVFLGITVPKLRQLVRKYAPSLALDDIGQLLRSGIHEERLVALLILVSQFQNADSQSSKTAICRFYLAHTAHINNWDLVDLSAPYIVGPSLQDKPKTVLYRLAKSKSLWERRIAILSTFHYIKQGQAGETLKIAELLLRDSHDLIHKAVGWMLREVGKRCGQDIEEEFLQQHYHELPRTALRYAIERFPEPLRKRYLLLKADQPVGAARSRPSSC